MATPRGKAKQALIAHAAACAMAYEKTAQEIRSHIEVMREKNSTEREMVEHIWASAISTLHEAPLMELVTRLSEFEVHDHLEKRT